MAPAKQQSAIAMKRIENPDTRPHRAVWREPPNGEVIATYRFEY
jgi:hypothetical protein